MKKKELKPSNVPRSSVRNKNSKKKVLVKVSSDEELEESSEEFEVEKILSRKQYGRMIKYLLKWKGFPDSENSWESKSNLNCPDLIKEFEDNLKKEKENNKKKLKTKNIKEKDVINKQIEADCSIKERLRKPKIVCSTYNTRNNGEKFDDFLTVRSTSNANKNNQKFDDFLPARSASNARKNSLDDFIIKTDSRAKHTKNKNAELHEDQIIKKKPEDLGTTYIVKKNAKLNERGITKKKFEGCGVKPTGNKNVEFIGRETIKKRHDDFGVKPARNNNAEYNGCEAIKKRHDDLKAKHTGNRNAELNKCEIPKKSHDDFRVKHTGEKNVELNQCDDTKKRRDDFGGKHTGNKNVDLSEYEVIKKRRDDFGGKHTGNKNVDLSEYELIKKRRDGLNQKKPEAAQNNVGKLSKTMVLRNIGNRKIPKIQHLQYYVKSANFPARRKDGKCSVMGVKFKGTDVLKGIERLVETGLAVGPLPDILYSKPIRTGATEFKFKV